MSLIVNPYAYFADGDGKPVTGNLYIGQAGKNAETYPIQVYYFDGVDTIPAPNPMPVSAGYIYNSGTATQIYTGAGSHYSIVLRKTDGSLVYSSLIETGAGYGASGGGTDQVFYENGQRVTANYTITSGNNAMSAGPITIDDGVVVTIPSGSTWTIV